jgi:hypothetical protein
LVIINCSPDVQVTSKVLPGTFTNRLEPSTIRIFGSFLRGIVSDVNESVASLSRTGDILVTLKIPLTGDWLLGVPSPSFGLIGFGEFLHFWLMYGSIVFASSASTYPLGGAGIGSA